MEGAILELNERRLVISWPSRTNARGERVNAHTVHSQRTWFKKCGGVCGGMSGGGGCLSFDSVYCVYRFQKVLNLSFDKMRIVSAPLLTRHLSKYLL